MSPSNPHDMTDLKNEDKGRSCMTQDTCLEGGSRGETVLPESREHQLGSILISVKTPCTITALLPFWRPL